MSTSSLLPLSFHADTHIKVGSWVRSGRVALKYEKKSGEISRSSSTMMTDVDCGKSSKTYRRVEVKLVVENSWFVLKVNFNAL